MSTTETDISCSLPDTPDTPDPLTTLTILFTPSTVTKTQQIWRDRFDIRISESFGVSIPATLVVGQANTFVNQQDMQAVQFGNFVRQRAPHGRTVSPNLLPKDPFNAPLINEPLSRRTRPIIKNYKTKPDQTDKCGQVVGGAGRSAYMWEEYLEQMEPAKCPATEGATDAQEIILWRVMSLWTDKMASIWPNNNI